MLEAVIERCMQTMTPEHSQLIRLKWKRQLSYRELAQTLDTTEPIIRQKLHRARLSLLRKLALFWDEQLAREPSAKHRVHG
ncbi:sigma-70 family RNA polymerase sigma factor [Paenibacillus sp. IB182496]|uniref:Sigma-70 family RNA polymerase sigma factor n=1 Tax=Paenibacillus sabuli TaxID=2772509 RepID=A0A927BPL7_9BACL|nr:sigma-70 family RNA polymerase sigma factor [Paenibacillus sabuli]MBD2843937.1 sigma-70 family RNA polymerase sigma factor [Paenibacillus sabuli]